MSEQRQSADTSPFIDMPVLQAKRRAFDHPTQANLDALIAAVREEFRDALLAVEGRDEKKEEKDHGAGLAAVENDTGSSPTETASDDARICPQDGSVCWEPDCNVKFCEEEADQYRVRGARDRILSAVWNDGRTAPIASLLDQFYEAVWLAATNSANSGIASPAASPALNEQTHVDLADAGSETLPNQTASEAHSRGLPVFGAMFAFREKLSPRVWNEPQWFIRFLRELAATLESRMEEAVTHGYRDRYSRGRDMQTRENLKYAADYIEHLAQFGSGTSSLSEASASPGRSAAPASKSSNSSSEPPS